MDNTSRTAKSLKNSFIALIYYIITLILQFFSRKIFINGLGMEILGLNSTAMNLFQFLNLAEIGIASAVGFTLYKPLNDNNIQAINEIVSLQGHIYKKIALLIIFGAIILMVFFPIIFAKIQVPLWYAYGSFGAILISALLGYFVNYRQIVLSADQKDYKILYSFRSVMLMKIVFQMLAVYYSKNGYVWWLCLEVLFAVIGSVSLHWMTQHTFPFLANSELNVSQLKNKYPDLFRKIKQLFFHKIGYFALTQSSPLIIYAYTSLTTVALYGNYLIIITGVQMLVSAVFNSTSAGIGNLVAEGNRERIKNVFEQLFGVRFVLVTVLAICTYLLSQSFVGLWIGPKYILSDSTLFLMIAIFFVNLFRYTVDSFLSAYGLFQDVWAPIVESILNIGLSIAFGALWGLNGVLLGVLISLILIVGIWKPIFLFKNTNFDNIINYVRMYLKHIGVLILTIYIGRSIVKYFALINGDSWLRFILSSTLCVILFGSIMMCGVLLINKPFYTFIHALKRK